MPAKFDDALPAGFRLHWYQIQAVLGDGGFGITYLGRDTNLNQSVAIKEYFPRAYGARAPDHRVRPRPKVDPRYFEWGIQRFLQEARLLARFRHPNIVRVLSVFETLGTAFMVMELERGKSFGSAIRGGALTDDASVLDVCMPLLDGLELVHRAGFIHRDVKPGNILLRDGLGPVLIDFGSARQPHPEHKDELTAIVSRGYAPFEQYDAGNEDQQGPWTDIYGMAATLYHAVTGNVPTEALTRGMAMLNGDPDPLVPIAQAARGAFSPALLAAIEAGLAFRAAERPQSIAEWLERFPSHDAGRATAHVRTEALEITSGALATLERQPASHAERGRTSTHGTGSTAVNSAARRALFESRRFLVVDDELSDRTLARRVLDRLGAGAVELVEGGAEAIERLRSGAGMPEVVICDLDMPGMDGLELAREMARQRLRVPMVLLASNDARLRLAAEAAASGYGLPIIGSLSKPLAPGELSRLLENGAPGDADSGAAHTARHVSDAALRDGMHAGCVQLVYQPVVSLTTRRVVSLEALVRWNDPRHGLVEPADFLGRIDYLGLSDALTDVVLEKAVAQAGELRSQGLAVGTSINLFPPLLQRLDLPDRLVGLAEAEGVDPRTITLEVNETGFAACGGSPPEVLARLRLKGIGLAIDDFGHGGADLHRLRSIPFTELKVHRGYVADALSDAPSYAILESCVHLARRLDMRAVAVGVQSEAAWEMLERLGFDAAQGFQVSEPLAGEALAGWLRAWQRQHSH